VSRPDGRRSYCSATPAAPLPDVSDAQVVHSDDPRIAAQYALLTAEGRGGPGYAVVNSAGQLRYRTFDPAPGEHAAEIQILIDALGSQA
jgi:hypothetical protein